MSWEAANQRYLVAALARVRASLEGAGLDAADEGVRRAAAELDDPPALDLLCGIFGLSPFERDTLLLCAGLELDASFGPLCAGGQAGQRGHATFALALGALPDAHWSALTPSAPLRHWRLVELGAGDALTSAPLRIDERILHFLAGVQQLDDRLAGLVRPVPRTALSPSHVALAERIAGFWQSADGAGIPPLELFGPDAEARRSIAAEACARVGLDVRLLGAEDIPAQAAEQEALRRLWERETLLAGRALVVEWTGGEEGNEPAALRFLRRVSGPLIVSSREPVGRLGRAALRLEAARPPASEQRLLWERAIGTEADEAIERVVEHFALGAAALEAAAVHVRERATTGSDDLAQALWNACRAAARSDLDDLAQRLEPVAGWDDLVLAESEREILASLGAHVRRRTLVHERWGFAERGERGLGISALFAGPSGTGKTMAAEVLARELELDLYRIDLSAVVSKYIGETEKNLRRVFDAAEEGGAILLFDEADALFGKRTEVKDSHDRYANIEVSYLLQRMEAYRGLAILTTNLKSSLDRAFLRRIRFVVNFPFPGVEQRAEIWRRIFPERTPTDGLEPERLAQLSVAGGNIRNIALNAAFLAADEGGTVGMGHVLRAARSEYAKLERPLTNAETGGWR